MVGEVDSTLSWSSGGSSDGCTPTADAERLATGATGKIRMQERASFVSPSKQAAARQWVFATYDGEHSAPYSQPLRPLGDRPIR